MKKSSVYLDDEELEALRRKAAESGRSQAELIREGVRLVTTGPAKRRFRSLGLGRGGGKPYARWSSSALYRKRVGGS
jgi:hypothetical protein